MILPTYNKQLKQVTFGDSNRNDCTFTTRHRYSFEFKFKHRSNNMKYGFSYCVGYAFAVFKLS